jgi:peptidoglycan hydrolase-like amidase
VRIAPAMLAMASVFVAVLAAPIAGTAQSVAAADGHCTDWNSTTNPPPSIAVYRVSEGRVERVDFKTYVIRVVSREWNIDAAALRRAGAVAVKQYAWYHVLHYRGGTFNGRCFDVKDTTADQLYASKPIQDIPDRVKHAVNDTWSWHLFRNDKFPMTGYRLGQKVECAANAGYRLYVRSAKRCAHQGWDAERILQVYYTANLIK